MLGPRSIIYLGPHSIIYRFQLDEKNGETWFFAPRKKKKNTCSSIIIQYNFIKFIEISYKIWRALRGTQLSSST